MKVLSLLLILSISMVSSNIDLADIPITHDCPDPTGTGGTMLISQFDNTCADSHGRPQNNPLKCPNPNPPGPNAVDSVGVECSVPSPITASFQNANAPYVRCPGGENAGVTVELFQAGANLWKCKYRNNNCVTTKTHSWAARKVKSMARRGIFAWTGGREQVAAHSAYDNGMCL